MKLQLFVLQLLLCLTVAWARTAVEDGQSDDGAVQSFKSPSSRQSPLKSSKSQSSPVSSKSPPSLPQQSAKSTPVETEQEYVDEGEPKEYEDDQVSSSTVASSTDSSKKIGNGVVRPFRSNQDLLETLKRRRQQKANAAPPLPTPTSPPSNSPYSSTKPKSSPSRKYGGRSKTFSPPDLESDQTGSESEKKTTVNRRLSGRGRSSPSTTQTYEEQPEEPQSPSPAPRPKTFGRTRRV